MGGALIHASIHLGPLDAWLDAPPDCLINFRPLYYLTEYHLSVRVCSQLDLLFVHKNICVAIGACLRIQEQQFGGTVLPHL
jgi:hypothetical protein